MNERHLLDELTRDVKTQALYCQMLSSEACDDKCDRATVVGIAAAKHAGMGKYEACANHINVASSMGQTETCSNHKSEHHAADILYTRTHARRDEMRSFGDQISERFLGSWQGLW